LRVFELPEHNGLTHVIDKGLGPRAWEDVLEVSGDHISIVKLGWGTAAVTQHLERKLDVLRTPASRSCSAGTLFEVVYVKDKLDAYKSWLDTLGLKHVEISDGTVDIPRERKLELIATSRATSPSSPRSARRTPPSSTPRRMDAMAARGARRRRVEGDHRGARGRQPPASSTPTAACAPS
jgi:Uncharacterized conserved protein